jgi:hypothetical protein
MSESLGDDCGPLGGLDSIDLMALSLLASSVLDDASEADKQGLELRPLVTPRPERFWLRGIHPMIGFAWIAAALAVVIYLFSAA